MRRLILAGGVAVLLAAPAGAEALSTATVSGNVYSDRGVWDYQAIDVTGGDGRDDISFAETLPGITVHDPGVVIAGVADTTWVPAGVPNLVCTDERGTRTCVDAPLACTSGLGSATCSLSPTNSGAVPQLVGITADGGAGDDRIVIPFDLAGATFDYAYGGPGDDDIDARYVHGGTGADRLHGFVLYDDEAAGIAATDDGVADDGAPGEGDDVVGGSGVEGTPFGDRIELTGDGDADAGSGDDLVTTRGGSATGGLGNDTITVTGGGFASGDGSSTTGGDDTIDVRNGVTNTVMCGPGEDTVLADPLDDTSSYRDCEHVTVG